MIEFIPIAAFLALAALSGILAHTLVQRFWLASAVGAMVTTVVWVGGIVVVMAVQAPGEMGGLVFEVLVVTIAIALVFACASGAVLRHVRRENPLNRPTL